MKRTLFWLSGVSLLAFASCRENRSPPAFAQGHYHYPGSMFAGATYEFDSSKVYEHWFHDVGPDFEGVNIGAYELDGRRVIMTFPVKPRSKFRGPSLTLYWTKLGRTQLLLDQESRDTLNKQQVLVGGFWALTDNSRDRKWWDDLLRSDSELRNYIPKQLGGRWKPPQQLR